MPYVYCWCQVINATLHPSMEVLVYQDCINVNNISEVGRFDVPDLLNDTLYTVRLVAADTAYNAQVRASVYLVG